MSIYKDEIIAATISGGLLFFSFPYFPFGILSLFSLLPILLIIEKKSYGFRQSFRTGYWFGLIYNALVIYWLANNILILAILVVFINALHYGIVFSVYAWIRQKNKVLSILFFPFWWTFFEYLREFSDIKFNWLSLSHTLTYYQPFIQFIDITGPLSLTLIIVVMNVLIFKSIIAANNKEKFIYIGSAVLLLTVLSLWSLQRYQYWTKKEQQLPRIKSGLVQPNIDSWKKWTPEFQKKSMEVLLSSSQKLLADSVNFIVWPETATPFYLRSRRTYLDSMKNLIYNKNVYLLTGSLDYQRSPERNKQFEIFNSAFILGPDRSMQKYDKVKLVPGAELTPFYEVIGFISDYIDVGQGNFGEGNKNTVMQITIPVQRKLMRSDKTYVASETIGVSCGICYDSVFPDLFQNFVRNGAELFVIITNDGWFGVTSGPYQHLQISVLRSIESRRSVIRCANTGISAVINIAGQIMQKTKLEEKAELISTVSLNSEKTFYDRYPRFIPLFSGFMTILLLSLHVVSEKVKKRKNG